MSAGAWNPDWAQAEIDRLHALNQDLARDLVTWVEECKKLRAENAKLKRAAEARP